MRSSPSMIRNCPALAALNQSATVTVPPGGSVMSDAVDLKVRAWQDVAVSLYVPDANVLPSQHNGAPALVESVSRRETERAVG